MLKTKIQKMTAVLAVAIFAGIGGYLVYFSSAAERENWEYNGNVTSHVNLTSVPYWPIGNAEVPAGWKKGSIIRKEMTAQLYNFGSKYYQLLIDFRFDASKYQLVSVDCRTSNGCARSGASMLGHAYSRHPTGFVVCVNLPPHTDSNPSTPVLDISLRLLNDYELEGSTYSYSNMRHGIAEGSCAQNPNGIGVVGGGGPGAGCNETWVKEDGVTRYGGTAPCGPNQSIGDAPFNGFTAISNQSKTGTTSQAAGPSGSSGSGSSGNSAVRVGNQPSSTPESAQQGQADDSEVEPSPFYDGREFARGSDQDGVAGVANEVRKKLSSRWLVVVIAIALGAAAGAVLFFVKKRKLG